MSVSDTEIRERKSVYAGAVMDDPNAEASAIDMHVSPKGLLVPSTTPPALVPDSRTGSVGLVISIFLRIVWFILVLPLALVSLWYLGIFADGAGGLSGTVYTILQGAVYILVFIPAIIFGLLPLSEIDKKPLIVRVFYWCTIPILVVGLLLL